LHAAGHESHHPRAAYDDLDRIYAWIAKDRPRSADSVIDRILESAEWLGRFP